MNIRQTLQNNIIDNLKVRFHEEDINWSKVEVHIDWFYNIYYEDLQEESNGKRLSNIFNCVNEILRSLNLFSLTDNLYESTERITLSILYSFMGLNPVFHKETEMTIYI